MADPVEVVIPDRSAFKAGEVCEIAKIQPYVLRTWETEFPDLGLSKTPGGPRIYRRPDVERVLRIRQLVFGDGLTLAGARRRLEQEEPPAVTEAADGDDVLAVAAQVEDRARAGVLKVKQALRSLLDLLDGSGARGRRSAERSAARSAEAAEGPARGFELRAPDAGREEQETAPRAARGKSSR